jgi:hypothetical protein
MPWDQPASQPAQPVLLGEKKLLLYYCTTVLQYDKQVASASDCCQHRHNIVPTSFAFFLEEGAAEKKEKLDATETVGKRKQQTALEVEVETGSQAVGPPPNSVHNALL